MTTKCNFIKKKGGVRQAQPLRLKTVFTVGAGDPSPLGAALGSRRLASPFTANAMEFLKSKNLFEQFKDLL
jgi:hypothetical protein